MKLLEVLILMYSISEVAKKMEMTIPTLRYYDNLGLFPNLKKNKSGNRIFSEEDIEVVRIIKYLKKSGMQLTEIKEFIEWCKEGDSTLDKRLNLFKSQKEKVIRQMSELQETLDLIEFKEWYYSKAIKDGTESIVKHTPLNKVPKELQKKFKNCHC